MKGRHNSREVFVDSLWVYKKMDSDVIKRPDMSSKQGVWESNGTSLGFFPYIPLPRHTTKMFPLRL